MRYAGRYVNGRREGVWRISNADGSDAWENIWRHGAWNGPATTWWPNGVVRDQGQYAAGAVTGRWTFRFQNGQLAATGDYLEDRKVGPWEYFDESGVPMEYEPWEHQFSEWDWAYDDYSGMHRGANWPIPPDGCEPDAE